MNTGKTYKTRQRAEIVRIMRSSGDCLTVREICERLSASGANVGETTVYRTLEKMASEGGVRRYEPGKGAAVYRLADDRAATGMCISGACAAARWSTSIVHLCAGWRHTSKRSTALHSTAAERCCTGFAAAAGRRFRNETPALFIVCSAFACAAACFLLGRRRRSGEGLEIVATNFPAVRFCKPCRRGECIG